MGKGDDQSRHLFEFPSPILKREGSMPYHYAPVPTDIAEALIECGSKRVLATVNGHTENRGIQNTADGEHYLVIGLAILKKMNARPGDVVIFSLQTDPNPDQIEIPEAFELVLQDEPEAANRFHAMTPGKKRSICMYVAQAKRSETKIKRSLEMATKLKTYTLHGDKNA